MDPDALPITDPVASRSWASSAGSARSMRGNRGRDTAPELAVRRLMHSRGYRFRVDRAPVRGLRRRADLLFTRVRLAVFIDGCFWHSCPDHYSAPRSNALFWSEKRAANVARDRDTDERITAAGWTVLRVWEHELPEAAVERIVAEYTELDGRTR